MHNVNKEELRASMRDKRQALTNEQICDASREIIKLVRALYRWKNAREALLYWPIQGEVDLRPLVTELWQRDCRVLLPRCRPDAYGEMDIACAACEDELVPGPFSIMEPDAEKCPPVDTCHPDIALIPGVAYDRLGNRLGFGGGYYDRLLATDMLKDALLVGVAYEFQLVDHLPTQPWDKSVNVVCTENELWRP